MAAVLAALRPHPHRGDIVAAGVVVMTVFTYLVNLRFASDWSTSGHFFFSLAITAPIVTMAFLADAGDATPRPYESILYVCDFLLSVLTLSFLADLIGIDNSSFNVAWVGLLLIGICLFYARGRNSAIMTLLAALTGVVVFISVIDWWFGVD